MQRVGHVPAIPPPGRAGRRRGTARPCGPAGSHCRHWPVTTGRRASRSWRFAASARGRGSCAHAGHGSPTPRQGFLFTASLPADAVSDKSCQLVHMYVSCISVDRHQLPTSPHYCSLHSICRHQESTRMKLADLTGDEMNSSGLLCAMCAGIITLTASTPVFSAPVFPGEIQACVSSASCSTPALVRQASTFSAYSYSDGGTDKYLFEYSLRSSSNESTNYVTTQLSGAVWLGANANYDLTQQRHFLLFILRV
jgi:hypothetical protein